MGVKKWGMTLPEILVVCGLLGLIFTILYGTLLPGIRAWKRSDIKSDLERNGLIAVKRISEELRSTDIESVRIYHAPFTDSETKEVLPADSISFLSPYGGNDAIDYDADTASIKWHKRAIFYLDAQSHNLYLQEQFLPSPTDAPDPYSIATFTPHPSNDRVIARYVRSLSFWANPDPEKEGTTLKNPITFEVKIRLEEHETMLQGGVSTLHNQK